MRRFLGEAKSRQCNADDPDPSGPALGGRCTLTAMRLADGAIRPGVLDCTAQGPHWVTFCAARPMGPVRQLDQGEPTSCSNRGLGHAGAGPGDGTRTIDLVQPPSAIPSGLDRRASPRRLYRPVAAIMLSAVAETGDVLMARSAAEAVRPDYRRQRAHFLRGGGAGADAGARATHHAGRQRFLT